MTHNKAVDVVRREQRRRADVLDEERLETPSAEPGPEQTAWLSDAREQVREAMAELSPEHREVVELAYFGGFSQSELAGNAGRAHGYHQEPHLRRAGRAAQRPRTSRLDGGGSVDHVTN